jgi:hypothetical protein
MPRGGGAHGSPSASWPRRAGGFGGEHPGELEVLGGTEERAVHAVGSSAARVLVGDDVTEGCQVKLLDR